MTEAECLVVAEKLKVEAEVVHHEITTDSSGSAWLGTSHIAAPRGTTVYELYILAHECGHVVLHDEAPWISMPAYIQEYEAEMYAHAALRRHGVAVPKWGTRTAKSYVRGKARRAMRSGKLIDKRIATWCGLKGKRK